MQPKVPFLDLNNQILPLRNELDAAMARVLDSCGFVMGEDVRAFETEFAEYCDVRHAIGVDSGTSALHVILRALDIGAGHEVILPANSFIATAEAVSLAGATPVFVDVLEDTQQIDVQKVEEKINPKTRAVIGVHLFGRTFDLESLSKLTQSANIHLIEDAAQAHGARFQGKRVGSFGVAAGFSFYPGKNLGAFGDAGAITTQDDGLATIIRQIQDHGQVKKYQHERFGLNARLDSLQAAVLRIKLRHLDGWNDSRKAHAATYAELLAASDVVTPTPLRDGEDSVYHLYVVRHTNRSVLLETLQENGIGFGMHYPVPIHRSPVYAGLGYGPGSCPISERLADEIISLPMFAELTREHIKRVCEVLSQASVSG